MSDVLEAETATQRRVIELLRSAKLKSMDAKSALIAHCDWSKHPRKRWMAVAHRGSGNWLLCDPEPVGNTADFLQRLKARAGDHASLVVGFDFPIGLPKWYAEKAGFQSFRQALAAVGRGEWHAWFDVCDSADDVSFHRPFYPRRPGGKKRDHLLNGLECPDGRHLLRRCERATPDRQAACSLFWTLGGNQVGKAAIAGWREILQPNIDAVAIWPFDGPLNYLLNGEQPVIVETYPGDVYRQIGIPRQLRWSKRLRQGRASVSQYLLRWISARDADASDDLREQIEMGFDAGSVGEDQFDALVGLFGILDVIDGHRAEGPIGDAKIHSLEGWILGQSS